MCLQSLGSSIDALKTLGPLLEAGFTGREDKPHAVVEAFRDYWDLTYADIPVPKGGWPSSVMTCLQACGRNVTAKPTPLPAEIGNVVIEKSRVPPLEPAFTWGSSSTIAVEEDGASDATETSQDSNPFITRTKEKEVELPSTPKAAPAVSSPQRPSKTATVRRTDMIFSPLAPTALDFVVAPASPTTPSRQPRTPLLRSPKKTSDGSDKENSPPKPPVLTSVLERIAMASPGGGGASKLGKRRASNTPMDSPPAKRNRSAHDTGKPKDDRDSGITTEDDDSEAEREEVKQCLLRPVTPSPAVQQQHGSAPFTAFNTVPRALLPRPRSCGRSPSPTPTPTQHNRTQSRKRKGVFMDAVEVPMHKPQQQAPRRSQPRRHCASLHMTNQPMATDPATSISGVDEEATPLSGTSSGPAVRRSLRRAKSLVGLTSTGVTAVRSGTPAQRAGRWQRVSAAFTKTKAKAKSTAKKATKAFAQSDDESDEGVVGAIVGPSLSSSSPISASLKRARVLFGSGKCQVPNLFFESFGRLMVCACTHAIVQMTPWLLRIWTCQAARRRRRRASRPMMTHIFSAVPVMVSDGSRHIIFSHQLHAACRPASFPHMTRHDPCLVSYQTNLLQV